MLTGEGFIFTFSLMDRNTLSEIENLYRMLLKVKSEQKKIPIVLVGNKLDICLKEPERRQVKEEDARALAARHGIILIIFCCLIISLTITLGFEYFETSAKDGFNVDTAWMALVRSTLKSLPPMAPKKQSSAPKNREKKEKEQKEKKSTCTLL